MENILDDVTPSDSDMSALVRFWLNTIYGPQNTVSFEEDVRITRILYELSLLNQKCDQSLKIAIANARNQLREYDLKNKMLSRFLCAVGLCDVHDTADAKLYHSRVHGCDASVFDGSHKQQVLRLCREFSNLAHILQLDSTDFYAMARAMDQLDTSLKKYEALSADEHVREGKRYYKLCDKKKRLQQLLRTCERQHETRQAVLDEKSREISYFSGKCLEYDRALGQLEEKNRGICADLSHSALQRLHDELSCLEQEVLAKREALKFFDQLPPDRGLLVSRIEGLRRELELLEEQFEDVFERL